MSFALGVIKNGPVKGASYKSGGPLLGSSDYNVVHLRVKFWTEDSSFTSECMDRSVFLEPSDNINKLTDTKCSYIAFCKDSVIPTKQVKVFPNNKELRNRFIKGNLLLPNRDDVTKVRKK